MRSSNGREEEGVNVKDRKQKWTDYATQCLQGTEEGDIKEDQFLVCMTENGKW